jgi:hypothetical protein
MVYKILKTYKARQNSRCQSSDTKQAPYWVLTDIRRHRTKFSHPGARGMYTPTLEN